MFGADADHDGVGQHQRDQLFVSRLSAQSLTHTYVLLILVVRRCAHLASFYSFLILAHARITLA